MDRRSLLKLVPATAVAGLPFARASAQTPLDDSSRKEFERLLAPQADQSRKLLELKSFRLEPETTLDRVYFWNFSALDITGKDHTPVVDPPNGGVGGAKPDARRFGEQLGPQRSAYAMAIVHIAMFEAVNAFTKKYRSYTGYSAATTVPNGASMDAAIAQATHVRQIFAIVGYAPPYSAARPDCPRPDRALACSEKGEKPISQQTCYFPTNLRFSNRNDGAIAAI